jgi:hypothetical protein
MERGYGTPLFFGKRGCKRLKINSGGSQKRDKRKQEAAGC